MSIHDPTLPLGDFAIFHHAGASWIEGHDPYGAALAARYPQPIEGNLNPPIWLVAFIPFAMVRASVAVWCARLLGLLAWVVVVLVTLSAERTPARRPVVAAVAFAQSGLWMTVALGQVYALLALLVVAAVRAPVLAAPALGLLVALKPNFGIALVLLLAAGHYRVGLRAFGVAVLVSVFGVVAFGMAAFRSWLDLVVTAAPAQVATNASWVAGLELVGGDGIVGGAVILAAVGAGVAYARPSFDRALEVGLLTSIVLAPVAWPGYALVVLPLLLMRRWDLLAVAALGLLCVPANLLWAWSTHPAARIVLPAAFGLWLGSVVLASRERATLPLAVLSYRYLERPLMRAWANTKGVVECRMNRAATPQ
ncbi:MAG: DUF2029 domain-containing protein [bacterium]|nr:DUF2029 domain-containing protein [bacterium]